MPSKKNSFLKVKLFADAYRIIDANLNRSKEGLRVCEDIARFHFKDQRLTKKMSSLRHRVGLVIKKSGLNLQFLFEVRDSKKDPGRAFNLGPARKSFESIFMANSQRTKEALRVLEELLKLFNPATSRKIQKLRFEFYTIEQEAVRKFRKCPIKN